MGTLTSSLIVRLVDQVSRPARGITNSLLGIQRAGSRAGEMSFGDRLSGAITRNNAALAAARGGLVDAAAGFSALRAAVAAPVQAAMEFESAMADVRKVVDFPTPEAFNQFQASLLQMSRELPMSVNQLAEMAAIGGSSGLSGDNLIQFVDQAARLGVAFDITAEEAGAFQNAMRNALGMDLTQVLSLGDAINHVSNSMAATAPQLTNFMSRVAGDLEGFGFSAEQATAFGAAMIASGHGADVAATSFRNMGRYLTLGASNSARTRNALRSIGLEATDVAARMQNDAVGTTLDVFERIGQMPEEVQAALRSDIFGNEARALPGIISNLDLIREALGYVEDESQYAGSAFREFEARARTFQNAVQIFSNRLQGFKVVIGAALIPAINSLMESVSPVVDRITEFAQAHPELVANVMAAVSALVALRVAAAGLRFVGLLGRGGALSLLSSGLMGLNGAAGIAKAALVAPFAPFLTHVVGVTQTAALRFRMMFAAMRGGGLTAGAALSGTAATMSRALLSLINPINLVKASFVALRVALISTGVGALVVALATAGTWVYNNWSGLIEMFAGIGEGIKAAFGPAGPVIDGISNAISGLIDWIGRIAGPLDMTAAEWRALGVGIGGWIGGGIASAVEAVNDFVSWVAGIPGRIIDAIGSIDLSSIIKWPEPPAWWTYLFGGDEPEPVTVPAPRVEQIDYDALPAEQANAAAVLEQAAARGVPSAGQLQELRDYADHLRSEIAAIQGEMDNIVDGPMRPTIVAPMEAEMRRLQTELDGVQTELAEGEQATADVTAALQVLSETEATPEVNTESITRALEQVRALSRELSSLRSGPVGAQVPVDGARAGGGDVRSGGTYLVGEEGPELVTFGQSGFVHTARQTARMLRGAASRFASGAGLGIPSGSGLNLGAMLDGGVEALRSTALGAVAPSAAAGGNVTLKIDSPLIGSVTVSSGQNPFDLVEQIGEALEARLARAMRGLHADGVT
jgi:TP901 family phage tail tape measure protein